MATDRRGYVRHSFRFPATTQRKALEAAGVKIIYEESRNETLADVMRALRKGTVLVVDGLHRLGRTRAELAETLENAERLDVSIEDARTGRIVHASVYRLMAEAFQVLAGEARLPSHAEAVRRGKKGGAPHKEKMARHEAVLFWRDTVKYPGAEDAIIHMTGWSVRQAYRPADEGGLGPRGAPAGRRRKH